MNSTLEKKMENLEGPLFVCLHEQNSRFGGRIFMPDNGHNEAGQIVQQLYNRAELQLQTRYRVVRLTYVKHSLILVLGALRTDGTWEKVWTVILRLKEQDRVSIPAGTDFSQTEVEIRLGQNESAPSILLVQFWKCASPSPFWRIAL